ncbi:MAG: hypothetical protein ABW252_20395 [Polyangiales bacterium]
MAKASFVRETVAYAGRARSFAARDWLAYVAWVGLMLGLFVAVSGFLAIGHAHGVRYPDYVWNIPMGAGVFVLAIAFDTIGHRTAYKEELQKGEALVHHITIFAGVASVVCLCLAYAHRDLMRIPALTFTVLSFVYSLIDEALHWRRYLVQKSDRVECWSHFFIFVGHLTMMLGWWTWFEAGYPGVTETVAALAVAAGR